MKHAVAGKLNTTGVPDVLRLRRGQCRCPARAADLLRNSVSRSCEARLSGPNSCAGYTALVLAVETEARGTAHTSLAVNPISALPRRVPSVPYGFVPLLPGFPSTRIHWQLALLHSIRRNGLASKIVSIPNQITRPTPLDTCGPIGQTRWQLIQRALYV